MTHARQRLLSAPPPAGRSTTKITIATVESCAHASTIFIDINIPLTPNEKVFPMMTCSKKTVGIVSRFCVVLLALMACERIQAQKLDLNANGMSDVWEQIYGAVALDPNLDSDGDGVSNLQ